MGMMKNYLLTLVCECAPENEFSQDAIEHAIATRLVHLTYSLEEDVVEIMSRYDEIIAAHHHFLRQEMDAFAREEYDRAA
jgi:hypothetical protein